MGRKYSGFNNFRLNGDTIEIEILNKSGAVSAITKVDKIWFQENYQKLIDQQIRFQIAAGYVCYQKNRKTFYLHSLVCPPTDGKVADHINRDKMDNRRENLRLLDRRGNAINRGPNKNNAIGIKNVSWNSRIGKYQVCLSINGKHKHIGYYESIKDAAQAAQEAQTKYHPEYIQEQ